MAEQDNEPDPKDGGSGGTTIGDRLPEEDARKLLNRPNEDRKGHDEDDDSEESKPGDRKYDEIIAGRKKARDERDDWKRKAEQALVKVAEYENAGKSETERLQGDRDSFKGRAEKAETQLARLEIALSTAPDHATLAQARKVAKRLAGDSEEGLRDDAEELWADFAPTPTKPPVTKPKERLKGGGEPDEDSELLDPKKLAALIPRAR